MAWRGPRTVPRISAQWERYPLWLPVHFHSVGSRRTHHHDPLLDEGSFLY